MGATAEIEVRAARTVRARGVEVSHEVILGRAAISRGSTKARLSFFAYLAPGEGRPIAFCMNGGPGSSSVWLHLGLGPRCIAPHAGGSRSPRPRALADNDDTWLTATDLVFLDPPATGFGDVEGELSELLTVDAEAEALADAVGAILLALGRPAAPRFLVGESFGAMRVAHVAAKLVDRGQSADAMVLISPVLDWSNLDPAPLGDLALALAVPTYAATAVFHRRVPRPAALETWLAAVHAWALDHYLPFLARGGLDEEKGAEVLANLTAYTGLSPELLRSGGLRVTPEMFAKQLLGGPQVIGSYDSRPIGREVDTTAWEATSDPTIHDAYAAHVDAIALLAQELRGVGKEPYAVFSTIANRSWRWGESARRGRGGGYASALHALEIALAANARLRVLVAAGTYDLATPFAAIDHAVAHLSAPARAMIRQTRYDAGHMIYGDLPARARLRDDAIAHFADVGFREPR